MSNYELVVLFQIPGGAAESSLQKSYTKIRDIFSDLQISIVEEIDMGRRPLSYEIKKQKECFYRLFRISFDDPDSQKFVSLNRSLGISDDVVRHMLVRQEGQEWGVLSSSVTGVTGDFQKPSFVSHPVTVEDKLNFPEDSSLENTQKNLDLPEGT